MLSTKSSFSGIGICVVVLMFIGIPAVSAETWTFTDEDWGGWTPYETYINPLYPDLRECWENSDGTCVGDGWIVAMDACSGKYQEIWKTVTIPNSPSKIRVHVVKPMGTWSTDGVFQVIAGGTDLGTQTIPMGFDDYFEYPIPATLQGTDTIIRLRSAGNGCDGEHVGVDAVSIETSVVNQPPVADFTADDITPDVGQTVTFTDTSTNTPTSWSWTIEGTAGTDYQYVDSTTVTSQNPHVRFLIASTYDVRLTASNSAGSDSETKSNYITVNALVPDIRISEVKPVQVVFDSDINDDEIIDLVKGKPTSVIVTIDCEDCKETDKFAIDLHANGQQLSTGEIVKSDLLEDKYAIFDIGSYESTGQHNIQAVLYNSESNRLDVDSVDVDVKDVNGQKLNYYGITTPIDTTLVTYSSLDTEDYQRTVEDSSTLIQAVYPLGNSDLDVNVETTLIPGSCYGSFLGVLYDVEALKANNLFNSDRQIGIVPPDYFQAHNMAASGYYSPLVPETGLATVNHVQAVAHELGHTYLLHIKRVISTPGGPVILSDEEYDTNPPNGRDAGYGFDVTDMMGFNRWLIDTPGDGSCFMGTGEWICNEDYELLFKKLRSSPSDPELIYIEGIILEDNTIVLGETKWTSTGEKDEILSGEYSIIYKDYNGEIIDTVNFLDPHIAIIEPHGLVTMPIGGFGFAIPYPAEANTVEISDGNKILSEFNVKSKLLTDAINSIPDSGFVVNPDQQRKALLNKVDAYEKLIEEGQLSEARDKLQFDIRDKIEKWLVDDYPTSSSMEYSKMELIELIDNLIG